METCQFKQFGLHLLRPFITLNRKKFSPDIRSTSFLSIAAGIYTFQLQLFPKFEYFIMRLNLSRLRCGWKDQHHDFITTFESKTLIDIALCNSTSQYTFFGVYSDYDTTENQQGCYKYHLRWKLVNLINFTTWHQLQNLLLFRVLAPKEFSSSWGSFLVASKWASVVWIVWFI